MNVKFPVVLQDIAPMIGIDNVPGLPATFVLSPQGKLVKKLYGEQTVESLEKVMQERSHKAPA